MKKIFSLVALFLILSSFRISDNVSNLNAPEKVRDCWAEATAEADWYILTGGSNYVAEAIWDAVYDLCSAQQWGIENCNGC